MNSNRQIDSLERKVIGLMFKIKRGEITPADSNIGVYFNNLRRLDLASFENLLKEYKKILEEVNKTLDKTE